MVKRWSLTQIEELFLRKPFLELIFEAQLVHRQYFDPNLIQLSTLLSIKTGGCSENCKYCSQSAFYQTEIKSKPLMKVEEVLMFASNAKKTGATRFCMGAAWKKVSNHNLSRLEEMIRGVKEIGMETCMTLGILTDIQAKRLSSAGLDFYNHNLDTSPEFYNKIITTRSYQERLDTLERVRQVGIKICSGGIFGLGERIEDRAGLLFQLANLSKPPESVPINMLIKVKGTPLENNIELEPFDLIRTVAVTRIVMPTSYVRLSSGREFMNDQTQAMCFMAGANSVFFGSKLLTASNPKKNEDLSLFYKLGLNLEKH